MPTPKLVQLTSWSYSRKADYSQCPAKARYKHILKLREPSSPALDKGNRIHALAAVWVEGKLPDRTTENAAYYAELEKALTSEKIPKELERFEEEFGNLRKMKALCEQSWCFDTSWESCAWNDWNRAWLRIKVDAFYLEVNKVGRKRETIVHIIDHKTGKEYPEHEEQRSLYALGAFLMFPDAVRVVAEHWYLDAGVERKGEWPAFAAEGLKTFWTRDTTAMLNDTTFAPRPGGYCQYCHFRKGNKGPCEF